MSLDMQGVAALRREVEQARRDMSARMESAVKEEAGAIMQRSRDEFAPRDTGTLIADSGVDVQREGDTVTATLWYGRGPASGYAVATHETPSEHDPATWQGVAVQFKQGGPKYLERPTMDAEDGFAQRVADRLKL